MKITDIKPQKKRKDRFNIYADERFICGLSEDTIIDEAIAIGQEIAQKEIDKLIDKDQSSKAMDKAIRFLGYRVRTEKEVFNKLKEKDFDKRVIKKTITKLKEMSYLSDQEFIETWVKDRIANKPSGKRLISFELKQKGISEKIAKEKLDKLVSEKQEIKMAQKALDKAQTKYENLTGKEKNQKIASYLARRGFDWQTINMLLQ